MSNPILASPRHPLVSFDVITHLGLKAHALGTKHEPVIGPRFTTGLLANLAADLTALDVVVPGAKQVRAELGTATVAHHDAVRTGFGLFRAARTAARTRATTPDAKHAYGVGQTVHPEAADDVRAALASVIDRAKAHPEEAASLGILQKDVDAMVAAHAHITEVGTLQSEKRASAPLTTKQRNQTANRILDAVSAIRAAGTLEFAMDPVTRADFEALKLPSQAKEKKGSKKGTPKKGAAPASPAPANGAVPSNGAPSNGAPANGAPANGAPSNGAAPVIPPASVPGAPAAPG